MTKACSPQIEAWPHTNAQSSAIEECISLGPYHEPLLEHTMELYKFHRATELAQNFAALLAPGIKELLTRTDKNSVSPIILIPVPLHKRRIQERGFDQNLLLAQQLCNIIKKSMPEKSIQYRDDLVIRTRHTAHQTTVAANKRMMNLESAFALTPAASEIIPHETIILVDDIVTTGATLNTLAATLSPLKAKNIYAVSVLRSGEQGRANVP